MFIIMINDLDIGEPYVRKYVDDTTTSEIVPKDSVSNAQNIADHVIQWSRENRVHLNSGKCKELRIYFAKQPAVFDPIVVNGKELRDCS